jgi:hypothetical protein
MTLLRNVMSISKLINCAVVTELFSSSEFFPFDDISSYTAWNYTGNINYCPFYQSCVMMCAQREILSRRRRRGIRHFSNTRSNLDKAHSQNSAPISVSCCPLFHFIQRSKRSRGTHSLILDSDLCVPSFRLVTFSNHYHLGYFTSFNIYRSRCRGRNHPRMCDHSSRFVPRVTLALSIIMAT